MENNSIIDDIEKTFTKSDKLSINLLRKKIHLAIIGVKIKQFYRKLLLFQYISNPINFNYI